jgi:hypothetical protein
MRLFTLVPLACAVTAWILAGTLATAQTNSDASKSSADAPAALRAAQTAGTRPLAEPRTSRQTARSKGDITFDDLKFDIEKGGHFERSMLTKDIEALNKQPVRLRGYILPNSVYKSSGIEQFVLVRDNMECCFGPGAAIYDCVLVNMEKGKTTDFTTKPVAVRGKFEIEEFKFPDGSLAAIYKMTASEVK